MLKIESNRGDTTITAIGNVDLVTAEFLMAASSLHEQIRDAYGNGAADLFQHLFTVGITDPDSPAWKKRESHQPNVSFGPQFED